MSEVSREEMREMRDTGRRAMEKVADVARQAAAQSGISRTFARVSKVNGDGTLQLELGSEAHPMPLYAVRSTTACAAAQPGDTVVVDTYAHVPLATGIVHTAGSAAHLVPPHDASAITSGTVDPARVPIGDGLTVSDGAIAVDNGAYVSQIDGWTVFRMGSLCVCSTVFRSEKNAYMNEAWGSIYDTTDTFAAPAYPVEFKSVPASVFEYVGGDEDKSYAGAVYRRISTITAKTAGEVWMSRPDKGVTIGHPCFAVIAMGIV